MSTSTSSETINSLPLKSSPFQVAQMTGELKIPTSYGHLAAKTWGVDAPNRLKVLAVHGWQDNAGTFDRLFPHLPLDRMYIVALDLPGHGSSSHLPGGVPYTDMTWVIEIKRALDYLSWSRNVTIIAHSMGANASVEVAALYPDVITSLVMLDTVKLRLFPTNQLAAEMAKSIELFNASQRNRFRSQHYVFDLEKTINIIIQTHSNGALTRDAALCLMQRAVEHRRTATGTNGYVFKRDPRLTSPVYRKLDNRQLLSYLSGIRCRLLVIRARNTHYSLRCAHEAEFLDLYRENCSHFVYEEVDGDHYVHLTNPHHVSPSINQFLRPLIDSLPT